MIYIKPYLLKLQKNNHSDFTDYCAYTHKCVNLLLDNSIHVYSIIIDNLRTQTKGIEFLLSTSNDPRIKSIQIIHCFCHLINLVFINTHN